jgi:hypothetical protein
LISMRLRMLESVTRVREVQVRDGRIYMGSYALEAGDIYELPPDYAQMLMSSGKAVSFDGSPLTASIAGASCQNVLLW